MGSIHNDEIKCISSLYELEDITRQIEELQNKIEEISKNMLIDPQTRKLKIIELTRKKESLKNRLTKGIPIDCTQLKQEIEKEIIEFLEPYGFKREFILEKLKDIKFYVTNERLSSGGLLSAYSNKIFIDYSLAIFDESGNLLGLKQDNKKFLKYLLIHEFLHICSFKSKLSVKDDGLSEGFTDFFAHLISNNLEDKSKRYDFLVRVCTLLTSFIGIKNALDDYINNLGDFPNLKQLFNDCGLDDQEFLNFYSSMNQLNQIKISEENLKEIYMKKIAIINYLKTNIFIPYVKTIENKEEYIKLFNELFEEFEITCSLEEVKGNIK